MSIRNAAVVAALTLGLATAVQAQDVNVDFESVPLGTTLDGLVVDDVLFEFLVGGAPSSDAAVQTYFPGCTAYVCGIAAAGPTGDASIVLRFLNPLTSVEFGLATSTSDMSLADVTLFDPSGGTIGMTTLGLQVRDSPSAFPVAEALFQGGSTVIGSIRISGIRNDFGTASFFALDNVRGSRVTVAVPEPATWMLLVSGLVLLSVLGWYRREGVISV